MSTVIDRIETVESFLDWLQVAKRGEVAVYHVGHLAQDRAKDKALHKLAVEVLRHGGYRLASGKTSGGADYYAYDPNHRVCLAQRRCADGFEYRAVRR